jgi:hypothetical protein
MSDNKSRQGKQDDLRVDSKDPSEIKYLHSQFPNKSKDEIEKAVRDKGPLRRDIEEHLRRG